MPSDMRRSSPEPSVSASSRAKHSPSTIFNIEFSRRSLLRDEGNARFLYDTPADRADAWFEAQSAHGRFKGHVVSSESLQLRLHFHQVRPRVKVLAVDRSEDKL